MEIPPKATYPEPLGAIVMAGTDSNPRRMIEGRNKAFLEVGGMVLVRRVVEALLEASSIGDVFVVGPADRLEQALGGLEGSFHIVEQAGKMLANAWAAIHALEGRYRELHGNDNPERPMLIVSCDLPIISAEAVDDFVARCAYEDNRSETRYAMLTGVAEEASLKNFYPEDGKDGIVRPYVNFAECRVRLANIYVGRPRTLSNQQFLGTGFDHRKAEKLKNVIILVMEFLGQSGGWRAAWITLKLQLILAASKRQGWFYWWLRKRTPVAPAMRACSDVLGGKVGMVITPYGGLSLDVDNDEDYRVLNRRYEDWVRVEPVEPGL